MDISRRDFNRSLLAGTAALATGAGLPMSSALAQAAPKKGGRLRIAAHTQSAKETLDPSKYVASTEYARGHMFYNGLVRLDEKAQAQPELAESFEASSDAKKWVFKLRKGITFHDGSSLTTNDVIYSIMRHKDEKVASAARTLAADIESVKADGPDTIVVQLSQPNADMGIILGGFHFMILKEGTTEFTTAIGTGPYKCKEFKPGIRVVGVRNENYFKNGRPYIDEIEHFGIGDPVARTNALLSGDVQMISDLRPNAMEDVKKAGMVVFSTQCPRFIDFAMMCDRPPTSNLDLRLAVKNLLDRERILNTILKGQGVIANDHLVMPTSDLYNTSLPQRKLDIDKAKFHLKKAGMENGRLEVHVTEAAPNSIEMGLQLQQDAAKAGLTIDLKREPADGFWANIWMKRAMVSVSWNPRPTYNIMHTLMCRSDAKWNDTAFKNERLDMLIDESRRTLDKAKAKELSWETQKIIHEEGGRALACFQNYIDGLSPKVKGLVPIPTGNLMGFNFADSVWLDA